MRQRVKRFLASFLSLLMVLSCLQETIVFATPIEKPAEWVSPVEKYGAIKVAKDPDTQYQQLCDENGKPIQLKGMSTFGLQWGDGEWVLNDAAFDALAYDWKSDVVRLAMYVAEDGYATNPAKLLENVEKGIQLATERGMYVIIDWHMLSPGDPTAAVYTEAGKDLDVFADIKVAHPEYNGPQLFFAYLSDKYGTQKNVIFETANEPNGVGNEDNATDTWKNKLLPYHQGVVDAIRDYDKDTTDNIVICGTDNWSQFVNGPVGNPVVDTNNQIMYAMHFYAGTHDTAPSEETGKYWLGEKVLDALNNNLAVFVTEWGISAANGDGGPFINYAQRWLDFLDEYKISWCAWSMAKKNEVSAAMKGDTPIEPTDHDGDGIPDWKMDELSICGNYLRAMIREEAAPMYTSKETVIDFEDGNIGDLDTSDDNSLQQYNRSVVDVAGNKMLKCEVLPGDNVWSGPRLAFKDLGTFYSVYKHLTFDVYLPSGVSDTTVKIQPVLQTDATGWWNQLSEVTLSPSNFTLDEATGLYKANVKVEVKNAPAGDKLGHITLLLGASAGNQGIYLDNIGFITSYNGDIADAPVVPDTPGTFVSLPFTFESKQREGWKPDGDSKLDYLTITVDEVGTDNHALSFPVALETDKNEWEDGARISSPQGVFNYADCLKYDALAMNIYLDRDKATTGKIDINICSIPNGDGYWYQSGTVSLDPTKGEAVTTPGGRELYKYKVYVPLNSDANKYGIYPFSDKTAIRNIILALANNGSDYEGRVYYDNIRYVDGDNLDDTDKDYNQLQHYTYAIAAAKDANATTAQKQVAVNSLVKLSDDQIAALANPKSEVEDILALYTAYNEELVASDLQKAYKDSEAFTTKVKELNTTLSLEITDIDATVKEITAKAQAAAIKALQAKQDESDKKQAELEEKQAELEKKQAALEAELKAQQEAAKAAKAAYEAQQKELKKKQAALEAQQKLIASKTAAIEELKAKQAAQEKALSNLSKLAATIKKLESKVYPKVGQTATVSNGVYKVITYSKSSKTVAFVKPAKTTYTSFSIPSTVKIKGVTFKVTSIASNAFKSNKKLSKVTIGSKVTKIGTKAFYKCSKLSKITIKATGIKSVGSSALKGIKKKAVIKVPSSKLKSYKKIFKGKGQNKTVKISK